MADESNARPDDAAARARIAPFVFHRWLDFERCSQVQDVDRFAPSPLPDV
jgi:hypothetical protein